LILSKSTTRIFVCPFKINCDIFSLFLDQTLRKI